MRDFFRLQMRNDDGRGEEGEGRRHGRGRHSRMEGKEQRREMRGRAERGHGERSRGEHGRGEHSRGVRECDMNERGGHRRKRFFGHGELRIVVLDILSQDSSHGYELIKSIENMTEGHYVPSAGVIYPTLDFLESNKLIHLEDEENGRKKITITELGRQWLTAHNEELAQIKERIAAKAVGRKLRTNPEMKRALDNIKAVLDLKVNQQGAEADTLKQIIGIIDKAALDISQLD
ncbi:PadR family transcriptional regulator [Mangrovibacter yixingensis]|uniref:PadR family transcriptional regulator n=1 Tax=Mangrovibacter yixingensis TaxID=1529639 RepID=UPI001CFCDB1F|nr:PadR family transcriptional regulator [Mangrovibacter yixingensis]